MSSVSPSRRTRLAVECLEDRRVLSTISGYVFNDANNNGRYDPAETPIANNTLQLRNSAGQTIGTAVTDVNGFYQFTTDSSISTAPATRTVVATFANAKTGWTRTAQVAQFDPNLGTLQSIDFINTPTMRSEISVENLDDEGGTVSASITGTLTVSIPGSSPLATQVTSNASFDAGPYDGVTDFAGSSGYDSGIVTQSGSRTLSTSDPALLQQFEGTGTVSLSGHATSRSTLSGPGNLQALLGAVIGGQVQVVYHYIPSNALRAGNYTIVQTSQPAGYLPGLKSSNGNVIPNSVNTNSISVTLATATSNSTNNNFAELLPNSLSGHVYVDLNKNGIRDSIEPPLAGVSITLTGSNDLGTVHIVTHTDGTGTYLFSNLRPGNYKITESQPSNYAQGTNSVGQVNGVTRGTKSGDQFFVSLSQAESGLNYDFAEQLPPAPPQGGPQTTPTHVISKSLLLTSTYRNLYH